MAKDSVIIYIDGDDTGYELSLKNIEGKTKKSVGGISEELKSLDKVAAGIATAVGTVGAAIVGIGVKYNAEMEQYKAGFTTMLGSAEQADKTIASLKSFAEKTPFELTDLANASTTLLAFGEDVNNLEADLKMLGDISLGNQEKFRGLALVFGQVQSQGKLMGQDLLQMINQGFNPLQVISEKTGESMASLKDKMSKGQISFEMVADAMKSATSAGGQFYNAMEAQSKTFSGQVSTLKDNITSLFGEMSEDISQSLTEEVLPKAIEMVEDLSEAWENGDLQKQIKGAAIALASLGAAVVGFKAATFANDMIQIVKGVKNLTAATKLGTAAQKLFNAELWANPYAWVVAALAAIVAGIATYCATTNSASEETKKFTEELNTMKDAHAESIKAIEENSAAQQADAEIVTVLKDELYDLENQLNNTSTSQEEAKIIQEKFNIAAEELEKILPGITSLLYDETGNINIQKTAVDDLTHAYKDLAIAKAMSAAYEEKMKTVATDLVNAKNLHKKAQAAYDGVVWNEEYYNAILNSSTADDWQKRQASAYLETEQVRRGELYNQMYYAGEYVNQLTSELEKLGEESVETEKQLRDAMDAFTSKGGKEPPGDTSGYTGTPGTKSDGKKETEEFTEQQKEQLRILNESYVSGTLSAKEYYAKLKKFRDDNFEEDSKLWKAVTQELKDFRDSDYKNLKYAHDIGKLDDEKYYKALAEHRDAYFDKGSDEWRQYTLEIYNWQKSVLDKIQQDANTAVDKFKQVKDAVVAGLNDAIADTYQTVTVQDGENSMSYSKLADIGAENAKLNEYDEKLDELFARTGGELPDYVMQQLKSMNVDDGLNYLNAMLRASDSEFEQYISGLNEKAERQGSIANKLLTEEAEELKNNLSEIYGSIPEGFFDIGEDSATEFAEGFGTQLAIKLHQIMQEVGLSMASFASPLLSGVAGGNSTTYHYLNNYYLQPSDSSIFAQQQAIRNQDTYNKMTN